MNTTQNNAEIKESCANSSPLITNADLRSREFLRDLRQEVRKLFDQDMRLSDGEIDSSALWGVKVSLANHDAILIYQDVKSGFLRAIEAYTKVFAGHRLIVQAQPSDHNQILYRIYLDGVQKAAGLISNTPNQIKIMNAENEVKIPQNCRLLSLEEAREILINGRVCYVCDEGQAAHEYDVTARPAPMLGADYYVIARRSIYSEPTRLLVVSSADYVALSQWYRGA